MLTPRGFHRPDQLDGLYAQLRLTRAALRRDRRQMAVELEAGADPYAGLVLSDGDAELRAVAQPFAPDSAWGRLRQRKNVQMPDKLIFDASGSPHLAMGLRSWVVINRLLGRRCAFDHDQQPGL